MGYKVFTAGEEALASDINNLLMSQTVARFASASARTTQLTAPVLNQLSMRDDKPGYVERWNGSAWVDLATSRELAYVEITANKPITATAAASGDVVVSAPSLTFDGVTPIVIEFHTPAAIPAELATASLTFFLSETPGVSLGSMAVVSNPAAGQFYAPVYAVRRFTPTAGAHTYTIGGFRATGNGTVAAAPPFTPAFVRISRAS